jgi:hypothetical protein
MAGKFNDILDAALPAAFVATIGGICFSGADYVALLTIEQFMERLGWLPSGWEDAHAAANYIAVALMTVPVTGLIGWLTYRTARKARARQDAYC